MRRSDPIVWWLLAGAAGACLLPWHLQQDGVKFSSLLALFVRDPDQASALAQALMHKRWWLWPLIAALGLAPLGLRPGLDRRRRGGWLVATGAAGLTALVVQAWLIGMRGWSYPLFERLFGELDGRQFGLGLGGAVTFAACTALFTTGLALRGRFGGDRFVAGAVGLLVASILICTVWPVLTILSQALSPPPGMSFAAAVLMSLCWPRISASSASVTGPLKPSEHKR